MHAKILNPEQPAVCGWGKQKRMKHTVERQFVCKPSCTVAPMGRRLLTSRLAINAQKELPFLVMLGRAISAWGPPSDSESS